MKALVAVVACTVSIAACTPLSSIDFDEFTIRVDSITGPNAVSGGVAFENQLWGTVGPNGCYHFKSLRTSRVPAQIDVTVIGEHASGANCTQEIATLRAVFLRVEPVIPQNFQIVVHQPDGTTLVRRIFGE